MFYSSFWISEIQTFKSFLDTIARSEDDTEKDGILTPLLEYLQSQLLDGRDDAAARPVDLIKTWHFANQANAEGLISSTIATLALLLRVISNQITFRSCGNKLCKLLLHDDQLNLFDRVFGASVNKAYLTAPCLKLLTEIVSFDGGQAAGLLYRQRAVTFKRLDVFLGMRTAPAEDQRKGRKRPSVRNAALRYLYANLRLQPPFIKTFLLTQGKTIRSLFADISEDVPNVIIGMLEVLKRDVACDVDIAYTIKGRLFNEWTLSQLSSLYGYSKPESPVEENIKVQKAAHSLLLFLCTKPGNGLLGVQNDARSRHDGFESNLTIGSNRGRQYKEQSEKIVRLSNRHLKVAMFLQTLRPHSSVLQSELIVNVFRRVPELVSDFFARKREFSFDPKPTATWIGYYAFLLSTIEQPLSLVLTPTQVGKDLTLPRAWIIDSIIPPPLDRKTTTRCLNQSSKLISYLSVKLLVASFEKLRSALKVADSMRYQAPQAHSSNRWEQFSVMLVADFRTRTPELGHIIAQFRSCPEDNVLFKESVTRLIALYYQVTPSFTIDTKLELSMAISTMAQEIQTSNPGEHGDSYSHLVLENLLDTASRSLNTQWWHKSGTFSTSPVFHTNSLP